MGKSEWLSHWLQGDTQNLGEILSFIYFVFYTRFSCTLGLGVLQPIPAVIRRRQVTSAVYQDRQIILTTLTSLLLFTHLHYIRPATFRSEAFQSPLAERTVSCRCYCKVLSKTTEEEKGGWQEESVKRLATWSSNASLCPKLTEMAVLW